MILKSLYDLYERLNEDPTYDVAPPGRSYQKVTFVVVLEPDGSLFDIQDARSSGTGGHSTPRRVLVPGVTKPSGAGFNPRFLWDSPGYLLGWKPDNPERGMMEFESFRDSHVCIEPDVNTPEFTAVCEFLRSWSPDRAASFPILQEIGSGFGVFQIRGRTGFIHEHPDILARWDAREGSTDVAVEAECLVTGRFGAVARLHPKVKGVAGSQPAGATIAGFNDSAYCSYGLTQSFNAPVSEDAAHRYTSALNVLLDGPHRDKHRRVIGGNSVVFWTEKPSIIEDVFAAFVIGDSNAFADAASQDEAIRAKLEVFVTALRHGRESYSGDLDPTEETRYHVVGLSAPTPARIAVRFAHHGTVAELLDKLRQHFRDIEVQRQFTEGSKRPDPEMPSVWLLVRQTARESADIPPTLTSSLFHAIMSGTRYPDGLYSAVLRRIAADRHVNYARACVIKGYLVRNLGMEVPVALDTTRPDPAYRLGRLFAALEKTQLDAHSGDSGRPSINRTIRDSHYSSASTNPATVVPRLLRTYQHHLGKLDGGRKVNRERLVQEILAAIDVIPAHLGLAEQGLFALGYYHQMNSFYTKTADHAETSAN